MTEKFILSQLHQLPEHLKVEVLHYIAFLIKEHANHQVHQTRKPKKRTFGSAKGKYQLAPDFDAPLDDFKEYMP
jgi:histidinol phosphatase-like enzyme